MAELVYASVSEADIATGSSPVLHTPGQEGLTIFPTKSPGRRGDSLPPMLSYPNGRGRRLKPGQVLVRVQSGAPTKLVRISRRISTCRCSPTVEAPDLESGKWWFESTHRHKNITVVATFFGTSPKNINFWFTFFCRHSPIGRRPLIQNQFSASSNLAAGTIEH